MGNFDRTDCCMSGLSGVAFSALRRLLAARRFCRDEKYDYAHRGLHEKDLSVPENPWQALRQLWKRATA